MVGLAGFEPTIPSKAFNEQGVIQISRSTPTLSKTHVFLEIHGNVANLMASLRLRNGFYGAQFRLPNEDGFWKQVSLKTKLSDVNAARRFANCAEQMALQEKAADKTHGMKYCEILLDAIRDAGALRLTEKKAREYLSRVYKVVTGKPLESYSVRNWFAEYLRQEKPNVASSTFTAYEWCYDTFLKFLGDRADAGIEFIEHSDIRARRDEQKMSGLSDKRVNNLLKSGKWFSFLVSTAECDWGMRAIGRRRIWILLQIP